MVSFLWIVFDVAITVRLAIVTGPVSILECVAWASAGVLLGGWAWLSEHRERAAHDREVHDLREKLAEHRGMSLGGFAALGRGMQEMVDRLTDRATITKDTEASEAVAALRRQVENLRTVVEGPQIEILSPLEGEKVDFLQKVYGRVKPPGTQVQTLVFAGGKWHPQRKADTDRLVWEGQCQFGDANSKAGDRFKLMVIAGPRIDSAVTSIPDGVSRSLPVNVVRK